MTKKISIQFEYRDDRIKAQVHSLVHYLFETELTGHDTPFMPEIIEAILKDMNVCGDWSVKIVEDGE